MMRTTTGNKPGGVHILAFTAQSYAMRIATPTGVVARLDRAIQ